MEDQIPGWEFSEMDYLSYLASPNTVPITESGILPIENSSDSIESSRSHDSGVGLIRAPIGKSVRLRSVSDRSFDSGVGLKEHNFKPANESRYTCCLCSETARRTYGARNSLKQHISAQHYPQFKMSCPYGDWVGRYILHLRQHFRSAHPGQKLPARKELVVPYEVPVSCALCDKAVRSWDEFYSCLFEHCDMKEMGPMAKSLPEEQAEPADASNIPPPSDAPLEMSTNPTNELMVKTDGDLVCDELLNNYLNRSDFVSTFSLDLLKKAHPSRYDVKSTAGLLSDLPDILWYFAEKLSFMGSEPYKRFGLMVCNQSGDIAKAVCNYYTDGIADIPANPGRSLYLTAPADPSSSVASGQRNLHYSEVLDRLPAYRWLVGCARKILTLDTLGQSVMQDIARAFPLDSPSSKADFVLPPTLCDADFILDWDPWSFLCAQEYAGNPVNIFDHVITLTGSLDNAQALTCVQYMHQTWPESSDCVMSLLHNLLEAGVNCLSSGSLQDGTVLIGALNGPNVIIHAQGLQHAIVEIAQQLAWLGAALQSTPGNRIVYCQPELEVAHTSLMGNLRYELKFTFPHREGGQPSRNGRCWHSLFRNPVVVYGFPIPRRHLVQTGLDIPLDILGRLVPSRRIALFGGKVCIKGHCTILVPTKVVDGAVIWHLICNDHGCYMDYTDFRIDTIPGLYPAGIDTNLIGLRHIVGWCPEAEVLTASPGANYGIDWSGLNRADTGCDLQDVVIFRGTEIPNYETLAIGKKDRPPRYEFGQYLHRILSITKKYAVFYDVSTRRAWLVDGASALLHLVRASLMFSSSEDPMQEFVFDPGVLELHPSPKGGPDAAISVLKSEKNLKQRLYRNMSETFQDRVDAIYHLLEQAYAYKTRVNLQKSAGIAPGRQARGLLEGFDFMDLATDEDHFSSRTMSAFDGPPRWRRLTRAINAITLFGTGFGDLLKPKEMVPVCSSWTTVPSGKDYLATRVEDIQRIMRKKGNSSGSLWRVIDHVYWHTPDKLFENCQCTEAYSKERCSHAQELLTGPEITKRASEIVSPFILEPDGAVIFDGSSVNGLPPASEVSFSSTLGGLKSPANDSAISVGYSPGSGTQESSFSKAEGKRPASDSSANPRKRIRRGSSNSSGDIHHIHRTERASDFGGRPGNESFVTSESSSQGSSGGSLSESRVETSIPRLIVQENAGNRELDPAEYKVGWICALQIEMDAAQRMLDRIHIKGFGHGMDCNLYILGQIGQLNVVLTCLPMGQYGNNIAAVVATRMMNRFPKIAIGLMVGIGGGLPSAKHEIRLGDVVVSIPHLQYGGVVQYDMGKFTSDGFITTGSLKAPPEKLLQVLNFMPRHGSPIAGLPDIEYPGVKLDRLFESSYAHTGDGDTCISCDAQQVVPRPMTRTTTSPHVFYGTIASGNSVVKSPKIRETLIQKHGVLCCEMEAAGLMNTRFPCLVIRGISDYADSHKNEIWMEYAAAAAAQYAKDLLQAMPADIALSDG